MLPEHDRRTFLTVLGSAAALTATATAEATEAPSQPAPASGVDITWFDAFKGKHKQVFDLGSFDLSIDTPLRQAVTYLSAHREINRLEPPNDINVIMGISHKAFPMNATDALWEKYALGEVWGIKDKATGKASVRNIFVDGPVAGPPRSARSRSADGVLAVQFRAGRDRGGTGSQDRRQGCRHPRRPRGRAAARRPRWYPRTRGQSGSCRSVASPTEALSCLPCCSAGAC